MKTNIRTFYDFVLQQMATESYLDQAIDFGGTLDTQDVLMYGSNNPINQQQRNNLPAIPLLPGATRMTATQADDFLTRFRIVSHLPNTATGFSGTLMERLNGQGNGTGEYTFAMRSTEYLNADEGGDWERDGLPGTDGEILLKGFALGQIASMESYYDHLKAGESYDALSGQWINDPALADFKSKFGQGGTGGVLNVSGYSLSGNLASVFTALHPEVDYTYVYNAAGRGNIGNGTLENMVLALRERLAEVGINVSDPGNANLFAPNLQPDVPTTYQLITAGIQLEFNTSYTVFGNASLPERRITQLYGQAAHNDVNRVANSGLHVPAEIIFIEDQPDIQGLILFGQNSDFGTTHSITLLIDSLAVMSAFERLGVDMSTPQGLEVAYNILAAGTHERATGLIGTNGVAERDSLETIVSGLNRLLIDSDIALMSDSSVRGFSNLTNRDDFYKVLDAINQKIATAGTLSLESLVGKTANDIILAAANPDATNTSTIAYRYALKTMNPFVVIGIDYSVHNQSGELDLYDPTTGQGQVTGHWLQDRSQFLHKKNVAYGADSDLLIEPGLPNTAFLDVGSSVQIYTTNNLEMPGYPTDPRRIAFGNNVTRDLLLGADEDDSLYGGGGNDEAHGFGGKDYLEGNSGIDDLYGDGGDDALLGGIGNDRLYGGADNDYLDGGADDDLMDGGQGRDTYVILGHDHIAETNAASDDSIRYWVDENNLGTLRYVSGALVNMGSQYLLVNDPSITAVEDSSTLTIYLPNSYSVAIDNFVSGQFGLSLQEIPIIPAIGSTIVGDYTPVDFDLDHIGVQQHFDSFGNVITDPSQPSPGRRDFLYGGAGNDRLMGLQGNDALEGRGGDDILEGGLDAVGSGDYLVGGAGNDQIFSTTYFNIGELQSYIYYVGNYGDDTGERDVLLGNAGNDLVVGDAGASQIFGGDGQDIILGGAGIDFISGDDDDNVPFGTWGNFQANQWLLRNVPNFPADEYLLATPAVSGSVDWIYAGSGNDVVFGLFGDDVIYGEDGDDGIGGGSGRDSIFGGNGNDELTGDNNGRLQNGQPWSSVDDDDDYINGGAGNDLIWGEGGSDILLGGTGVNSLYGGAGNDYLVGGDGDLLVGEKGNDVLLGGSGTDSLNGGAGNDSLYGGDAFDFLSGEDGDDVIYGEGGSDQLSGDAGNDLIDGGDGSDHMFGGAGDDTYFVDAIDTIGDVEGQNYVLFTDATTVEDIQVDRLVQDSFDVLFLTIGDGGFIPGHPIFTYQDPNQASYFQSFTFGDGVTLAMDEILGLRFDASKTGSGTEEGDKLSGYGGNDNLDGAGGNDVLRGYSGDDILIGGAGVDMLSGGEGNDTLDGGAGTDTLVGGAGNDIYLFDSGSGPDTISENDSTAGNLDIVQFTSRIVPADVTATRDASNLYLSLSGGVDRITLQNWFVSDANKVEQVKFVNGTVWDVAQLAAMSQEANHAPTVTNAIADQTATEDAVFNFVVPANSFADVDAGDTLNYGAALTDGSALPSWLDFNASTHTFNGTPVNANVGTIKVKVTAVDATSAAASDVFDVVVTNANDAPTVVNAIADQNIMEDSAFTFRVPTNSFADVDMGDSLVYGATLANGSALPSWLTFNAATLTFVGSPTFTNAGTVSVSVTASDGAMLSASDVFDLTVNLNSDLAINGTSANDSLVGHSGNDTINGNAGRDTMAGARGNDTYVVDNVDDVVTEFASQGTDLVQSSVTYALAANVENLTLTGSTAINGKGNSLDNILTGNSGNNTISAGAGNDILNGGAGTDRLVGAAGNDILQGFEGNDILNDRRGNGLFDGGRGNDTMKGNANNQMFIGGAGNDSITTGTGADIIAFNSGAGRDIVNASTGTDNSISLGGGIRYSNLTFTKRGSDLVLNTGGTDKLILADWYTGTTNKSVGKLQVIAEAMSGYNPARGDTLLGNKVVIFDFAALAAAFDSAGQVNGWALTNALLNAHLSGSDTDAIGGDLAYQYGKSGSLTGIGLTPVQDVINSAQFGSSAQTLHTLTELQRGQIRLS